MRRSHGDRKRRYELHDFPSPEGRRTGNSGDSGQYALVDRRHDHLQRFGDALTATGDYVVRIVEHRTKPPELHVRRVGTARLTEDIGAECDRDGTWYLIWSWGERICRADDIKTARVSIGHVLTIRM
jgi:hypothetical protein